jgi:hypothetical protein
MKTLESQTYGNVYQNNGAGKYFGSTIDRIYSE